MAKKTVRLHALNLTVGKKKAWQSDRIESVLSALFPGYLDYSAPKTEENPEGRSRVPPREQLSNAKLIDQVLAFMREHRMINEQHPPPSSESILRTAGRK